MPSCIVYAFSLALSLQVLGGRSEDAAPSPGLSALAAAKSSSSDPNEIAGATSLGLLGLSEADAALLRGNGEGLVLYAEGRSCTGSAFYSLIHTLERYFQGDSVKDENRSLEHAYDKGLVTSACHNMKESFFGPFRGPRPWGHERATNWSALALRECQEVADEGLSKGGRRLMFHIKPSQLLKYGVTGDQAMRDIHNNTNIRTAVFLYRHNKLAEWVSYAELRPLARQEFWGAKEGPATQNLVHEWEEICTHCEEAEKAAADLGMRVIRMDYLEIVRDTCAAVRTILRSWLGDVPEQTLEEIECLPFQDHWRPHPEGLANRIGKDAALDVRRHLRGTPYAWMLDLRATAWPQGREDEVCFGR